MYQFKMDFSHKLELLDLILPPHDSPDSVRGHEVQPEPIIHRYYCYQCCVPLSCWLQILTINLICFDGGSQI